MLFIFDMGGVVTSTFSMDSFHKKLNLTEKDFKAVCSLDKTDIWQQLQTGKISTDNFWNEFNNRIGFLQRAVLNGVMKFGDTILFSNNSDFVDVPQIDTDPFRLYFHPVINPGTVELIQALKKKHRVVCGTNTIQSHWENHMERGDYSYFDQTYASNKIGAAKPDKHFFELILEAEGCDPKDAFFTDDREENVKAAASLGINAELFTSAEELKSKWSRYC